MVDSEVARAAGALGREIRIQTTMSTGGGSRPGVYRVRADHQEAVLKVTTAERERQGPRRELRFYRDLADRVPVGTPRLLDFADNDDLTVLLLAAHTPASPAREWDLAAWLEVAGDLAALHSIPLPEDPPWVHVPWVRQVLDRPPAHVALDYWSGTRAGTGVASMLKTAVALVATLDEAPRCFNHGDCHAANLLRDGSRFLWSDWEVAGIGTPAIDLAFLWLRANSDDADVPYDAMLQEYARLTSIDPVLLRRSAIAAELGFTVYGFPDYAGHHSDRQRERVTSRLLELIAEWDTGP